MGQHGVKVSMLGAHPGFPCTLSSVGAWTQLTPENRFIQITGRKPVAPIRFVASVLKVTICPRKCPTSRYKWHFWVIGFVVFPRFWTYLQEGKFKRFLHVPSRVFSFVSVAAKPNGADKLLMSSRRKDRITTIVVLLQGLVRCG